MFTGIIEELGTVAATAHGRLQVRSPLVLADATLGASLAVNGCCLTVVEHDATTWWADVSAETLARTSLGSLEVGARVNLERPVALGARLGGHVVQGHVDAVGRVAAPAPDLVVAVPPAVAGYVVEKGSITVDGVSLTVAAVRDEPGGGAEIGVAVIPHTAAATTLGLLAKGDPVNLEVDVLAKYVERLLGRTTSAPPRQHPGAAR